MTIYYYFFPRVIFGWVVLHGNQKGRVLDRLSGWIMSLVTCSNSQARPKRKTMGKGKVVLFFFGGSPICTTYIDIHVSI